MKTPLSTLYSYACQKDDLIHWLHNEDIVETYSQAKTYALEQQSKLFSCLTSETLTLYQKFLTNSDEAHQLECEMLFYQGLAMGLQLGTLPLWA